MFKKKLLIIFTALALTLTSISALMISPEPMLAADEAGAGFGGGSQDESNKSIQLNLGQEAIEKELPGSASSEEGSQTAGFSYWLGRAMSIILIVAALLVLVNLLMGAIKWITAGGDSGKLSEAQKQITSSIIGLIVLAAVVAIFQLLTDFLQLDFITFTNSSPQTELD